MWGLAFLAQPPLLSGIPRPARLRRRGELECESFHARAIRQSGRFVLPMCKFELLTRRRKMLVIALRQEPFQRAVHVMGRAAPLHAVEAIGMRIVAQRLRITFGHQVQNSLLPPGERQYPAQWRDNRSE